MALFIDKLAISSPAVASHGRVPDRNTADHENEIPVLSVSGIPDGTVELAIVCHDPDAPLPHGFTHWTLYGLAPREGTIDPESDGARPGPNGIGAIGWSGPQPPPGHGLHHYYFWVYALSRPVDGAPTREDFLNGHADAIIEQARLVGTYER